MPKKKRKSKISSKLLKKKLLRVRKQTKSTLKKLSKLSIRTKLLFLFGILFLGTSLVWNLNQTIQLTFFTPKVIPVKKTHAIPTQLIIPRIFLDLLIEETAINNGAWQVAQNGASHLTISARPGEDGPIIMYGHNTTERLGPIRWLSKGDIIEIKTADDKKYPYKISETIKVSPNKMDIFTNQNKEVLIIYTCDGFADLERFVVIAKPQR
jgi:LPXTG-site transpeptidase (sortase) family protein